MPRAARSLLLIPLLLISVPAAGQDSLDVERLEQLRFERMREALELNDEQVRALRSNIEEFRRQSRESRAAHAEAMERLRQAVTTEDEAGVEAALSDLERRRVEVRERQARHEARLAELLRPDQRARFLLFHERFDSHLRALIRRHRGGGRVGAAPPGPMPAEPHGGAMRRFERRRQDLSPERRQQQIERLQKQIEVLQERLEELERPSR